jgi:RecA-family ATPase
MAMRLLSLNDLVRLRDPEWMVDGLVGENALVELFGKPGAGKSFLALDLAMSVATGEPWLGQTPNRGMSSTSTLRVLRA